MGTALRMYEVAEPCIVAYTRTMGAQPLRWHAKALGGKGSAPPSLWYGAGRW
jgi:hypothetical protein